MDLPDITLKTTISDDLFELLVGTGPHLTERDVVSMEKFLATVSYKAGWDIRVGRDAYDTMVTIRISGIPEATDKISLGQLDSFALVARVTIPIGFASWGQPARRAWIYEEIKSIEVHELAEFLRFDGDAHYNPHRDGFATKIDSDQRRLAMAKSGVVSD